MIRAKKVKLLRYKHLYVKGFSPLELTSDIGEAKNFYPIATIASLIGRVKYQRTLRVVNGYSISGHFDSKMEVETGGVKGTWMKFVLWLIRYLEKLQRKTQ